MRDEAGLYRFSAKGMATIFEILICHEDRRYAHQAADAAFGILERLEQDWSRFICNSDIAQLNAAKGEMVPVSIETQECLEVAEAVRRETGGAFDINYEKKYRTPFFDLGGIGKGAALDYMVEVLADWEIGDAMLHGGQSTVLATGERGWPVNLSFPAAGNRVVRQIDLCKAALSSSGLVQGEHIIDPRTGEAVRGQRGAWVRTDCGARADALSTAFMVMTRTEIEAYCLGHPDVAVGVAGLDGEEEVCWFGEWS